MPITNTPWRGWIARRAAGKLGRGVFMRGNHVDHLASPPRDRALRFPLTPPVSPVTAFSVRLFNELYFHRPGAQQQHALWHYQPFLFPLDRLLEWNRLYGPRGFFQYQCVLPGTEASGGFARHAAAHRPLAPRLISGGVEAVR